MARSIAVFACLSTAALFALFAAHFLMDVMAQAQSGEPKDAMVPMVVAVVCVVIVCLYGLRGPRNSVLIGGRGGAGRVVGGIVMFMVLGLATFVGLLGLGDGPLASVVSIEAMVLIFPVYVLVMLLAFLAPGTAYFRTRGAQEAAGEAAAARPEPERKRAPFATLRRIIITPILLYYVAALLYSYAFDPFVPSPELAQIVDVAKVTLMTGTAAALALVGMLIPMNPRVTNPRSTRYLLVFGLPVLAVFAPDVARSGLPALHALSTRAPVETQVVTVVEPGRAIRKRRCNWAAKVAPAGSFGPPTTICGIPRDLHRTLSRGDTLRLTGQATMWGMRYTSVEGASGATPSRMATGRSGTRRLPGSGPKSLSELRESVLDSQ